MYSYLPEWQEFTMLLQRYLYMLNLNYKVFWFEIWTTLFHSPDWWVIIIREYIMTICCTGIMKESTYRPTHNWLIQAVDRKVHAIDNPQIRADSLSCDWLKFNLSKLFINSIGCRRMIHICTCVRFMLIMEYFVFNSSCTGSGGCYH